MEPTNGELLTHILYIKEGVKRLETAQTAIEGTVTQHVVDIAVLKAQAPKTAKWGAVGGFVGGIISGFLTGRVS